MTEKLREFEPHGWLRSRHLQTMAGAFLRRKFVLPEGEERLFRVDAETQLKGVCHWQDGNRGDVPVIVIVDGLVRSCGSNYVPGNADKAFALGLQFLLMHT